MGFIRFGVKSVLELKLSTFVGQEILVEHQEKDRVKKKNLMFSSCNPLST